MLRTYRPEPTSEMSETKRQKFCKRGSEKKKEKSGKDTPRPHYIKAKTKEKPQRATALKVMPAISLREAEQFVAALSPRSPFRVADSSVRGCSAGCVNSRRGKTLSAKPRCTKLLRYSEIPDAPCAERSAGADPLARPRVPTNLPRVCCFALAFHKFRIKAASRLWVQDLLAPRIRAVLLASYPSRLGENRSLPVSCGFPSVPRKGHYATRNTGNVNVLQSTVNHITSYRACCNLTGTALYNIWFPKIKLFLN